MIHEELLTEIERLNSICSKPMGDQETQRRTAFLAELERKFMWLSAAQWRDVVTWVIDNHKTRALPTIEEFSRGVNSLRNSGKISARKECDSCNGSSLVYRTYRHRPTGQIVDAMVPCPECRRYAGVDVKSELEPVEDFRTRKERLAEGLSPRASMYALELADKLNLKFDDTTALVLVQRTALPMPEALEAQEALPVNVSSAEDLMGQVMANKRAEQAPYTPKRAPPKAEWVQPPLDAQSRAAGEIE